MTATAPKKSTSHDNWRTPPEFFKVCDQEFDFVLDACASFENKLVDCNDLIHEDYLGLDNSVPSRRDALVTDWLPADKWGAIWCNPPYSRIGEFVAKAYEQSQKHGITVCVLIPAYTDPRYWSDYVMRAHEVRFLKGRLSFLDEDGLKRTSARFPSVLVVFKKIKGRAFGKAPNQFVWDWRYEDEDSV